jgi:hypothetical protein
MSEENNTLIKENEKFDEDIEKDEEDEFDVDDINYEKYILDLSLRYETRIKLIHRYFQENQNNAIEIISRISGMYQFSGAKILEKYLNGIALETKLSDFLNVEAVKGLLSFTEFEEDIYDKDDDEMKEIKTESNDAIRQRNELRQNIAYESLNIVCSRLGNELATPYKIDVICSLMENEKYKDDSSLYFIKVIDDDRIDCDYRYKSILSLERKKISNIKFHLYKSLMSFSRNSNNLMMYRILSSQYLLQSIKELMTDVEIKEIEQNLLEFAENEDNEYNLRADASDVLLSLGSEEMKIKGREIIMKLGGKGKTIFDNKQNVHVKEIEKSVMVILETICYVPIVKFDDDFINFDYVDKEIQKLIDDDINDKEKILISLNRIRMDRTLYSVLCITLSVVMVKLWSYICSNENKDEMQKRLLQELEDMAGTCSSGFISRLVNTISGFGDLSIQISFEDQIVSNFSARLNSYAQKICDDDSVFRTTSFEDVKKLYLKKNPEKTDEMKDTIIEEFYDSVLNEMMLSSSDYRNRPSFLLFFRTYMSKIREEMFNEFIEYVSESEFDLYFRKALSYYDGIRDVI